MKRDEGLKGPRRRETPYGIQYGFMCSLIDGMFMVKVYLLALLRSSLCYTFGLRTMTFSCCFTSTKQPNMHVIV